MTITKTRAVELIEQAVETHGADYVDPYSSTAHGCWYVKDGTPSCIVGTAYALAGASVEQVRRLDNHGTIDYVPEDAYPIDTTPEAIEVFTAAQTAQDNGYTWGEALAAARLVAEAAE